MRREEFRIRRRAWFTARIRETSSRSVASRSCRSTQEGRLRGRLQSLQRRVHNREHVWDQGTTVPHIRSAVVFRSADFNRNPGKSIVSKRVRSRTQQDSCPGRCVYGYARLPEILMACARQRASASAYAGRRGCFSLYVWARVNARMRVSVRVRLEPTVDVDAREWVRVRVRVRGCACACAGARARARVRVRVRVRRAPPSPRALACKRARS
eukprot:6211857-Pleurochrysis_carterae.AAC.2